MNPCLFSFTMLRVYCQRYHLAKIRSRLKLIHFIVLLLLILLVRKALVPQGFQPHPLRPRSDDQLNNLQIIIHAFQSSRRHDPGGWLSASPFHAKDPATYHQNSNVVADFGSLHIRTLKASHFAREIDPRDASKYDSERTRQFNRMDLYPVPQKYDHDDELDYTECRAPNWKNSYFPNCNAFHEIDVPRYYDRDISSNVDTNYDSYIFSHGYYRDAWLVEVVERHEAAVLKTLRFKHDFSPKSFRNVQRDAIVMERLTFSPYVIAMYGHCATSLTVEPVAFEIEDSIVPGEGYMKQEELNDKDDVKPQNDYTTLEKLELALAMAESLAVLHSYEGGLIVHDDVQLCQWLRTRDDRLVLGDFNRAEIMDWNEEKGEYCMYNNGYAYGNYRSPEEFAGKDLNEKIDIFSFGNNVYSLMTGLWPFYENEDDLVVQGELIDGKTAFIDNRYRTRSYAEGQMVELIERCWSYKPEDRPDIFEVVRFLQSALREASIRDQLGSRKASNY